MRVRLLTEKGLDQIKADQKEIVDFYQQTKIDPTKYESFDYPDIEFQDSEYPKLEDQNEGEDLRKVDYRNSLILSRFFGKNNAPLSLLHDERYMAYLTHFVYFDYMKKRWPIKAGDESSRAVSQYTFFRAPYARNGILRLFWPAYLIAQASSTTDEFEKKLYNYFANRLLLDRALERKYSVNPKILDLLIEVLMKFPDKTLLTGKNRSGILPKLVQNILATTSLDTMDRDAAFEIVNRAAQDVASGKYDHKSQADYSMNVEDAASDDAE